MKTSTFKTRLIGKALSSFTLQLKSFGGDKAKMQDLIGGSVLVFQTLTIKPWAFFDSPVSLAQARPQLVQYHPERRRATLYHNLPQHKNSF